MTENEVEAITNFEVSEDGEHFTMRLACRDRSIRSLRLSTDCIANLMLALPRLVAAAIKAKHGSDDLRVALPVERVRIFPAANLPTLVVTLMSPGGYEASYAVTAKQLRDLADLASDKEEKLTRAAAGAPN